MKTKNNIKILRIEKNLSQIELAEHMHVHQTAISQWESGKTKLDMQTADKLALFFDVSVDYLMGRTNERAGSYHANNVETRNFLQGNGSIVNNDGFDSREESEKEILKVYRQSNVKGKAKIWNVIAEVDEENKRGASAKDKIHVLEEAGRYAQGTEKAVPANSGTFYVQEDAQEYGCKENKGETG